jgi:lipoyl(octanoyl) transferase
MDTLLLLEHEPVVTLGRDAHPENVRAPAELLAARGVEVVSSDRGGDATFHGPGQIVAYPILDLRPDWCDVRRFVNGLERTMIDTLAEYGLQAAPLAGHPGVWLSGPDRKIGALGARVRRWVTNHGLALNVTTDLSFFDLIVPCGIRDKGVTSLARELGRDVPLTEVEDRLAGHLARIFGREIVESGRG